jgi:hypothetical protein
VGAKAGNTNAKKAATRVDVHLSIADEEGKFRRGWAVTQLWKQGNRNPTPQQISRFIKDWCYARIDEAMYKSIEHMPDCESHAEELQVIRERETGEDTEEFN